jgi:hypothetical protein
MDKVKRPFQTKYYRVIDGVRYDRSLIELVESFTAGSSANILSEAEVKALAAATHDAYRVTAIEKQTLAYIRRNYTFFGAANQWWDQNVQLGESIQQSIFKVKERLGVPGLRVEFTEQERLRQLQNSNNSLSFLEALQRAINSLFNDTNDVESPRTLVMELFGLDPAHDPIAATQLDEKMRQYFNTGRLGLLPEYDPNDETSWENLPYPIPENRELVSANWIFVCALPDLSDHIFWAIVDRAGEMAAYNYGFN